MTAVKLKTPRLAVRAVIVEDGALLLVNAWPGGKSDLLCAPGGGVEPHSALPDNLIREVREETGLIIEVGEVCLVNEFHDQGRDFHQVEIFFRAQVVSGTLSSDWEDPEAIVTDRRWATEAELTALRVKPSCLPAVAFGRERPPLYDPLEPIQP